MNQEQQNEQQKFMDHLNYASKIVSEWPEWKKCLDKKVFGGGDNIHVFSDDCVFDSDGGRCVYCGKVHNCVFDSDGGSCRICGKQGGLLEVNDKNMDKNHKRSVDSIVQEIVGSWSINEESKEDKFFLECVESAIKEAYIRGCVDGANNGELASWAKELIEG